MPAVKKKEKSQFPISPALFQPFLRVYICHPTIGPSPFPTLGHFLSLSLSLSLLFVFTVLHVIFVNCFTFLFNVIFFFFFFLIFSASSSACMFVCVCLSHFCVWPIHSFHPDSWPPALKFTLIFLLWMHTHIFGLTAFLLFWLVSIHSNQFFFSFFS